MKKFIICIIVVATIAASVMIFTNRENDPIRKNEEEFGTIWYGTTDASIRVRRMDTKEEYYQIYLCWYSQDGTVKDYQKMGICHKDELHNTVDQAVKYYEEIRE